MKCNMKGEKNPSHNNDDYHYTSYTDNYKCKFWIKEVLGLSDQSYIVPYLRQKLEHKQINTEPIC